jgi:uncharacterized protein YukE
MKVSFSSFYQWKKRLPSARRKYNEYLKTEISNVYHLAKAVMEAPKLLKS